MLLLPTKISRKGCLFLTGFLLSAVSLSWTVAMLPLSWLGFPGYAGDLFLFVVILLMCLASATPFLLFEVFFKVVTRYKSHFVIFPVFLGVVILVELSKAILLWLLFFKPGIPFDLDWVLTSVGYYIAYPPFLAWGELSHIYGLSICFAWVIYLIYLITKKEWKPFYFLFISFIIITYILNLNSSSLGSKSSSLQNVIVYPEGVSFASDKFFLKDVVYIDGDDNFKNDEQKKLNLSRFSLNGLVVKTSSKEFLMPFGEYMPSLFKPIAFLYLNTSGNNKDYDYWLDKRFGYSEIKNASRTFEISGVKVATLLCSEVVSYSVLSRIRREKPDVVYLQASYLNFNKSAYFHFFVERWRLAAQQYLQAEVILVKIQ